MKAIINDISFQYTFYSQEEAFEKLHSFLYICKSIESGAMKNIENIISGDIDPNAEIVTGTKIIKLLQRFETKDELRYLLGILTNRPISIDNLNCTICTIDGKCSTLCSIATEHILISLCSNEIFCETIVEGEISSKQVKLRNISQRSHICYYRKDLGIRIYKGNLAKHKSDRENAYGKGKIASKMDIDGKVAQELLDRAILYKGKLYARKNNKNYAFQNEQDVIYHGYIADDLGDDVIGELDKHHWE